MMMTTPTRTRYATTNLEDDKDTPNSQPTNTRFQLDSNDDNNQLRRSSHNICNDDDDGIKIQDDMGEYSQNEDRNSNRTSNDWKQTLAGIMGNVFEWYDFAIFGYLGDIIGEVFFPSSSESSSLSSLSSAYLLFGIAFFIRPIGGIILGYIGDIYGRKYALIICIYGMAFSTFVLGCLPGYATCGIVSIVCLIVLRLIQGFSVGGQLMSSLVFTLEQYNDDRSKWGFYGSLVMSSASL